MLRTRAALCAAALAVGSLWLSVSAQQPAPAGTRRIVSDLTAAGIDRGLRDNDAPRPPRANDPRVDRSERYLRGSIIVKFREGTSATARAALMRAVNGAASQAMSYADFDIVSIAATADPEAAARTLAAQPDVEYAQARYRAHPMFA